MTAPLILLVEDNPMNAELAGDLLEVAGFRVVVATDTAEAETRLDAERPDLLLLDLALPGESGLAFAARLRKDPRWSGLRIVALTAQAMRGDREEALAAGCDGYLAKPIDTRTFAEQVRAALP